MRIRELLLFVPPAAFIGPALWCIGFILLIWLVVNAIVSGLQEMVGLL